MHVQPRLLRAHAENLTINRRSLSDKEREREGRILATAQSLMARYSRDALTMSGLAGALNMATATLRRQFADIDSVLGEILIRHLFAVSQVLGQVPRDQPGRQAAQRAAYIEATRNGYGGFTEAHRLLIRERHSLPPDLAEPVEQMRYSIGELLAGKNAAAALGLLDCPDLQPAQIEAMLAAMAPPPSKPPIPQPQRDYRNLKIPNQLMRAETHRPAAGPPRDSTIPP